MSSKQKNPYADTEWIRAYHIEVREVAAAHDVLVTTHICTAIRPDRVVIRMEAHLYDDGLAPTKPLCSYETCWPDPEARSFSCALFQASAKLTRLIEDSLADVWKTALSAQRGVPPKG